VFSSDIGHWDVPDMAGVLHEAYEPVEAGFMSPADFEAFTFGNIARMYSEAGPGFFAGTSVADAVSRLGAGSGPGSGSGVSKRNV
jgi:hypothetical protein